MTKGTAFGIAMAAVGGLIALFSAGPKCEGVETKKANVTVLRCEKKPGHFDYDEEGRPLGHVPDTYKTTVLFQGNRYVAETFGPWKVGSTIQAYMDEIRFSDGDKKYRLVSLIGGE